jgi:hypothetical protein
MHEIVLTFVVAIGLTMPGEGRLVAQPAVPLEAGSHALMRLDTAVGTRTAHVGDPVDLRTASPIVAGGLTIPVGSDARGVVSRVNRPGGVPDRGELEIRIVSIVRPDGEALAVVANSLSVAPPRRPAALAGVSAFPSPTLPILAGMVAGYAAAGIAAHWSHSEDTVVRSGVVTGIAAGVLVAVLRNHQRAADRSQSRGEDLILPAGAIVDAVFEGAAADVGPQGQPSDISGIHAARWLRV